MLAFYRPDTKPKGRVPTEAVEQTMFVQRFHLTWPDTIIFHVPNEGRASIGWRLKQKRLGLISGAPDLIVLDPVGEFHGLLIEMKRSNGVASNLSDNQKLFLTEASDKGYFSAVCFGADAAMNACVDYFNMGKASVVNLK